MGGAHRRPRIVCWGELLWDVYPDGRRLGGAPANAAYHASVLGNRGVLVTRVGRDTLGDEAIELLRDAGVDTRCVQRDELPTGTVEVDLSSGDARYTIRHPSAWDRIELAARCIDVLSRADAFCYGTLAQRDGRTNRDALDAAIRALPDRALRICDLNLRPPFDDPEIIRFALAHADVVKLNEREAIAVANAVNSPDPIDWMLSRGAAIVAVTRGATGSELITVDARYEHVGRRAAGGDPVGAGDAYTAALVHHLLRRTPLDEAAELCNRYAGYVASQPGGMPPIPADLRRAVARR